MGSTAINERGAVLASTVRDSGSVVSKDTNVTLPAISPVESDFNAMGPMTLPTMAQIENMETSISKNGTDANVAKLSEPKMHNIEVRWVQPVLKPNGTMKNEGCKAFIKGTPKGFPSLGIEPGSKTESEILYSTVRMQIFAGNKELCCVDRLAGILRINGKDYYKDISSLL